MSDRIYESEVSMQEATQGAAQAPARNQTGTYQWDHDLQPLKVSWIQSGP